MDSDSAAVKLGKRIGKIRDEKEVSHEKLAQQTGLSVGYIIAIEEGARDPQLTTIAMIAEGLNVEIDQLFCSSSSLE